MGTDSLDTDYLKVRQGREEQAAMEWLAGPKKTATPTAPTAEPNAELAEPPKAEAAPAEDTSKPTIETLKKSFMEHPHVKALGKIAELDQMVGDYLKGLSMGEPETRLTAEQWVDKSYPGGVDQFIEKTAKEQGVNAAAIGPAIRKTFADLLSPLGLAFSPLLRKGGKVIQQAIPTPDALPAPGHARLTAERLGEPVGENPPITVTAGAPTPMTGPQTAQSALPAGAAAPAPLVSSTKLKPGMVPNPAAIMLGDKAVMVDVTQLTSPEAIAEARKAMLRQVRQQNLWGEIPGPVNLARGFKPIPDDVTKDLAQFLGKTPDELLLEVRGDKVLVEQAYADSLIVKASYQRLTQTAEMRQAGMLNEKAMIDAFGQHERLSDELLGKFTESAQTLRIAGVEPVKGTVKKARTLKEEKAVAEQTAINLEQTGLSADDLAQIVLRTDAATLQSAVRKSQQSGWDYFTEYIYGSALSNPATHAVNIFGSMLLTPSIAMMERAVAARIGSNVASGEATAMLHGYLAGMSRGWQTIHQASQQKGWFHIMEGLEEAGVAGATKVERAFVPAFTSQRILPASLQDSWLAAGIDGIGAAIRLPSTALRVSDIFMKAVNTDMEVFALATRKGKIELSLEGDALTRYVNNVVDKGDDAIFKQARQFGEVQTFTNALEGKLGSLADALSHPAVAPVVMFVRTPTNIFRYSLERTPGLNMFLKGAREDLKAGGARRDLVMAKMAMGTSVAAMTAGLAMGDLVTGGGPQNPDVKKVWSLTHAPYSINVSGLARKATGGDSTAQENDTWIGYNRADPVAPWIGMVADAASMAHYMDEDTRGGLGLALALGMGRNLASKTYTKDIAEFFNIFNVKGSDTQDSIARNLNRYLDNKTRLVVPAGVAAVNRMAFDADVKEVRSWIDVIMSRIPGLSKSLAPVRDPLFGNPISPEGAIGPDLFSPFPIFHARKDAVADELVNLRVPLDLPRYIEKIELTGKESEDLTLAFTRGVKVNDMNLHQYLGALMQTEHYRKATDGPDGDRASQLKAAVGSFRAQAIQMLKDQAVHQDLRRDLGEAKGKKYEKRFGGQAPDAVRNPPHVSP